MILVIGEILFDELPGGRRPGGAPFNFAQHLHRLGEEVLFVSRVGNDKDGDSLLEFIREAKLTDRLIQRDPEHETGRVEVHVDRLGIPHYTILPDTAYDHIDFELIESGTDAEIQLLYFGSLIQRTESGRKQLQRFLGRQPDSILRLYDMNLRAGCENKDILIPSLEQTDILKINEEELAATGRLIGSSLTGEELIVYLIETFKIKQIALTRGPEGSRLYTDDGKRIEQKAGSVPDDAVVDTVGAGDSYTAVLAYGNLHRIPPEETVRAATQLSEQICTIAGAIPPDNRFYKELNLKR